MPRFRFSTASPAAVRADLLVLPMYTGPRPGPGVEEVGAALGVDLAAAYAGSKLSGKRGQALTIPTFGKLPAATILLVGLGERGEGGTDALRRGIGKVAPQVARFRRVATTLAQAADGELEDAVQATVEGLLLGSYRFTRYKTVAQDPSERRELAEVTFLGRERGQATAARRAIERGVVIAESVAWARDLVNTPAIDATPDHLAREAQRMAREAGLRVKVWSRDQLERGGFGGILGVGRGSSNEPRLIELRYQGAGRARPIALTGKGVTFDSGGLSIKDSAGMEWMKADMGGAAAMLAVMRAVGLLKPRVNVIAAIPSSENMPDGGAIRPGDVLRHRGGKTSEVLNTDAEGRLILADALAFLAEQEPRAIVDAATLTGACMVALGTELYGAIGNDRDLVRAVLDAGEAVGEHGWELPLWKGYRRLIDSNVADVKNVGERWGGAISAALFLREFVGDTPWVHLDVAGTAFAEKPGDYWPKGATGSPARAVIRYLLEDGAGAPAAG
ncbi:MAG: leucyl aminopeptidase [Actinobacteria bacterium]|nr:leucyl aminopeptidase [Actinomycetota bacterium]